MEFVLGDVVIVDGNIPAVVLGICDNYCFVENLTIGADISPEISVSPGDVLVVYFQNGGYYPLGYISSEMSAALTKED